jgi:hypothetical protein
MARLRKQLPSHLGVGEIRFRGLHADVEYEILGEPTSLRLGPLRLRGSFATTPEIAAEAFRAGEAQLTIEGGSAFRITLLGHTEGSTVAYFEMRV